MKDVFSENDLVQIKYMPKVSKYKDEDFDSVFIVQASEKKTSSRNNSLGTMSGVRKPIRKVRAIRIYPVQHMMVTYELPVDDIEIYRKKGTTFYDSTLKLVKISRLQKGYPCSAKFLEKITVLDEEIETTKQTKRLSLSDMSLKAETEIFNASPFTPQTVEFGQQEKVNYSRFETIDECLDAMRDLMMLEKMYKESYKKEITAVKKKMAKLLLEQKREMERT